MRHNEGMRAGRTSTTASIVASARGAAGIDPIASRLVPRGFRAVARGRPHVWTRWVPLVDHMRVRTLAIDENVRQAAERGTEQLVILGAGLCARAWRMPELADTTVYEVDHPSSQRYKRARLEGLEPKARAVSFVGVDFEKDDLATSLAKAGHDAHASTTWIWEGVTPYLTPSAIAATIGFVRELSAPGSTFIITYGTPVRDRPHQTLYKLVYPLFRAIGEPIEGLLTIEEMHRLIENRGFAIEDDATYPELAKRLGVRAPRPLVTERVLVARVPVRRSANGSGLN
jgi:methyltransferase (TIGR00027 family)